LNKIMTQIAQCMTEFEAEDGVVRSRFLFPEDFIGFQGHFPEKKVLPGVCQVQTALAAVGKARGHELVLKEIALAKYFAPVGPGEEILCVCTDVPDEGGVLIKATITKGSLKVSELKLRVTREDNKV
jgi:3-hydroxymyristoyl/3-hydroxydecanoyl-(acyl carrier protein) dehydratase